MSKILFLIAIIVIIVLGVSVCQNFLQKAKKEKKIVQREEESSMPQEILSGKKVAMIVAFRDFRDEEYFVPKEILEKAGVEIKTISNEAGQAIGADGGQVKIDFILEDLKVGDFDAVVFIGGPGALKYLDSNTSYEIAQETVKADKILGAICVSPVILAKADVLGGKKATVWSAPFDKASVKALDDHFAIYQNEPVVIDDKIITANGPAAAKDFGLALIEVLK